MEINAFGLVEEGVIRTAVLYRDAEDNIIDWRWYTSAAMIPRSLGDGRLMAVWMDQGFPRTVFTTSVVYVGSREDRELAERTKLPAEKRRKLSACPTW